MSAESGHVALGRLGQVVEQVAELVRAGKQVILVSSGAVGIGRRRLAQQRMLGRSLGSLVNRTTNSDGSASTDRGTRARMQCTVTLHPIHASANAPFFVHTPVGVYAVCSSSLCCRWSEWLDGSL